MKHTFSWFAVLSAVFIFSVGQVAFAQDKVPVKVKGSEVVTGVVIVHVLKDAKSLDLQCNEGAMNCSKLASGSYLMAQLPENYGMYDCKNVEMLSLIHI